MYSDLWTKQNYHPGFTDLSLNTSRELQGTWAACLMAWGKFHRVTHQHTCSGGIFHRPRPNLQRWSWDVPFPVSLNASRRLTLTSELRPARTRAASAALLIINSDPRPFSILAALLWEPLRFHGNRAIARWSKLGPVSATHAQRRSALPVMCAWS